MSPNPWQDALSGGIAHPPTPGRATSSIKQHPQSHHQAWRVARRGPCMAWPAWGLAADGGGHQWILERVVSKGKKLG